MSSPTRSPAQPVGLTVGDGGASAPTPLVAPEAPAPAQLASGTTTRTVSFTPASGGEGSISYSATATASDGSTITVGSITVGATIDVPISGLTNGVAVEVDLTATDSASTPQTQRAQAAVAVSAPSAGGSWVTVKEGDLTTNITAGSTSTDGTVTLLESDGVTEITDVALVLASATGTLTWGTSAGLVCGTTSAGGSACAAIAIDLSTLLQKVGGQASDLSIWQADVVMNITTVAPTRGVVMSLGATSGISSAGPMGGVDVDSSGNVTYRRRFSSNNTATASELSGTISFDLAVKVRVLAGRGFQVLVAKQSTLLAADAEADEVTIFEGNAGLTGVAPDTASFVAQLSTTAHLSVGQGANSTSALKRFRVSQYR